jgi:hypothetical protein
MCRIIWRQSNIYEKILLLHIAIWYIGDHVFDIGCGNKPDERHIRPITGCTQKQAYTVCDVVQSSLSCADIQTFPAAACVDACRRCLSAHDCIVNGSL